MTPRRSGAHRRPSRIVAAGLLAVAVAAAAVSIALVGPSAAANTGPAANDKPAAAPAYNGEALLLGLFFGVGLVAEQYPKLALTDIDETPENLSTLADMIAELRWRSPGFLEQFRSSMDSGDPELIAEVAAEAINRLAEHAIALDQGTGSSYGPKVDELLAVVNGKPHGNPGLTQWAAAVAAKLSPAGEPGSAVIVAR